MARARNIKPGFFKNEDLCELEPFARLLFAGLWTLSDRAGRLENRPKRIKAEVFPYDEGVDVVELLKSLRGKGFLILYSVAGTEYIQIVNWDLHQHPHVAESASTIPAPDSHGAKTSDSLLPITDSLNPISPAAKQPVVVSVDDSEKQVRRVWDYYAKRLKRTAAYTYTEARRKKGLARYMDCLKHSRGDPEKAAAMLKQAVDALAGSEFHVSGGYIDWIDNLFKSTEQLQKWLDKQGKSNGIKSISDANLNAFRVAAEGNGRPPSPAVEPQRDQDLEAGLGETSTAEDSRSVASAPDD